MTHEFAAFWAHYPRKIGKLDAFKAYQKARKLATADEILEGVAQYREHLPEDMKFVPHPSTWLNQGRWADEYDPLPRKVRPQTGAYAPYRPSWRQASGE